MKSDCYDLHSHTLASDGSLSPAALVERAASKGVTCLAITDHDTTRGFEALNDAETATAVIPGIEISCQWNDREVHIVGLLAEPANKPLREAVGQQVELRRERALAIAEKLEKSGVDGASEFVSAFAEEQVICRTHMMRFLLEQGTVKNSQQAFKRYLGRGAKAYVKGQWMPLSMAIQLIRDAQGVAILAHPGRYGLSSTKLKQLAAEFKALGGEAMEVIYPNLTPKELALNLALVKEYELAASQGSDFHDPAQHWTELGRLQKMPDVCRPIWQEEHLQVIFRKSS